MTNPVDTQSAGADSFIGSHLKAKNGYGQNGFQGASSDLPGEKTTSGFLPECKVMSADWMTRKVSGEQYPTTHSMRNRNAAPTKIGAKVDRR